VHWHPCCTLHGNDKVKRRRTGGLGVRGPESRKSATQAAGLMLDGFGFPRETKTTNVQAPTPLGRTPRAALRSSGLIPVAPDGAQGLRGHGFAAQRSLEFPLENKAGIARAPTPLGKTPGASARSTGLTRHTPKAAHALGRVRMYISIAHNPTSTHTCAPADYLPAAGPRIPLHDNAEPASRRPP
jgi:hypothetical protein